MNCFDLENLSFSYLPGKEILKIKELSISKGERVFIHGPSGSGKSTLLNLLAGVLSPSEGTLKVLGEDFGTKSIGEKDRFRGDHIGFVFQSFNLIPYLSIRENISLPTLASKERKSRIKSSINEEIKAITDHLGLSSFLDKQVSQLSIGQQQRVGVARALIGSPEIVIADEPTSSLDDDVTDSFMKLLIEEQEKKNFTLVFVSHDRRLEKHFNKTLSLKDINGAVS